MSARKVGKVPELAADFATNMATKPTNPKDAIAGNKLQFGLVPDVARIALALAFTEGAVKYGRFNWRVAGVRSSVYRSAMERHMVKWWNGQDKDPATTVHHLANLMACCAIILDAELYNMLTDDRPPAPDRDAMANAVDSAEATTRFLKNLFANFDPHQPTLHEPFPPAPIDAVISQIIGDSKTAVPAGTNALRRFVGVGPRIKPKKKAKARRKK